jgi:DNA repair exonuclease SbcCD ATPase subunit
MLEELEGQEERLSKLNKLLADKESELGRAKAKHAALMKEYAIKLQHYENNAKTLQQLTETRDSMHRHNELIRKLRNARPEIASKMWGTVLGAISRYFSQIRGEQSVVTRDADGFKVNGRSVAGLSGSTNDALGLAIRMALSKLFLPGVPFLMIDEGFSGADSNRELAGVGTLAGAGFSQVLLITHSDRPESVADNLITL